MTTSPFQNKLTPILISILVILVVFLGLSSHHPRNIVSRNTLPPKDFTLQTGESTIAPTPPKNTEHVANRVAGALAEAIEGQVLACTLASTGFDVVTPKNSWPVLWTLTQNQLLIVADRPSGAGTFYAPEPPRPDFSALMQQLEANTLTESEYNRIFEQYRTATNTNTIPIILVSWESRGTESFCTVREPYQIVLSGYVESGTALPRGTTIKGCGGSAPVKHDNSFALQVWAGEPCGLSVDSIGMPWVVTVDRSSPKNSIALKWLPPSERLYTIAEHLDQQRGVLERTLEERSKAVSTALQKLEAAEEVAWLSDWWAKEQLKLIAEIELLSDAADAEWSRQP